MKAPQAAQATLRQWFRFKEAHPNCVLFFRMGTTYELYYEDAELAERVLGVAAVQRIMDVPVAAVPFASVEVYLRKMILAGHRCAVCEATEPPAPPTPPGTTLRGYAALDAAAPGAVGIFTGRGGTTASGVVAVRLKNAIRVQTGNGLVELLTPLTAQIGEHPPGHVPAAKGMPRVRLR